MPGFYTLIFYILLITQDLNKMKTPFCVGNVCKISAKNIKLYTRWCLSKACILNKQPGFLEIIEICLNLGIKYFLIRIIDNLIRFIEI